MFGQQLRRVCDKPQYMCDVPAGIFLEQWRMHPMQGGLFNVHHVITGLFYVLGRVQQIWGRVHSLFRKQVRNVY